METRILRISGMTCGMCAEKVRAALEGVPGVSGANVDRNRETAEITCDPNTRTDALIQAVRRAGYGVQTAPRLPKSVRAAGTLILIAGIYLLLESTGVLNRLVPSALAQTGMSYGALFAIGLTTSLHCAAMCGGIGLSQSLNGGGIRKTLLYQLGRVVSYIITGLILGFAGMLFGVGLNAGLSMTLQGALKLFAGLLMLAMGLNLLGLFPAIKGIRIRLPMRKRANAAFVVGLLNGLMPCGPLQSMQLVALASASPVRGALSMLCFSLGTVPLMLGIGSLAGALNQKFRSAVNFAGAVLVAVMALSMLSQGAALIGAIPSEPAAMTDSAESKNGVQVVRSTFLPNQYPSITVEAGKPVKWIIDAADGSINGCNNRMYIPDLDLEYTFHSGENIIEFTAEKTMAYTCWMGMLRGNIEVVS